MGGYAGPAAKSSAQSFYYDDSDVLVYSYITDTYVETIESMGIDQVIKAYQSAGERYFGRID